MVAGDWLGTGWSRVALARTTGLSLTCFSLASHRLPCVDSQGNEQFKYKI